MIFCYGNFLESMRGALVRTANNGGYRVWIVYLCSQTRLPLVVWGYIRLNFWLRGSLGDLQTTHADAEIESCFLKTDGRALLLNTTSTLLTECRKVELLPVRSVFSYLLVSLGQEGTLQATKIETWSHNFQPTICPNCKIY